jgi:hypothetical protein
LSLQRLNQRPLRAKLGILGRQFGGLRGDDRTQRIRLGWKPIRNGNHDPKG